jgi:K+-sensing histidine kinase KdpD
MRISDQGVGISEEG